METGPILITLCEVRWAASISYLGQCNPLDPSGLRHQRWHGYCCDPRPNAGSCPLWATSSRAAGAAGQRATIEYRDRRAIKYREHSQMRPLPVVAAVLLAVATAAGGVALSVALADGTPLQGSVGPGFAIVVDDISAPIASGGAGRRWSRTPRDHRPCDRSASDRMV